MELIQNSFAKLYPDIAKQWDSQKNGELSPDLITVGSSKKIWWKCAVAEDHEWEATVVSRVAGSGCPFCAGVRACRTNCLATLRPDIVKEWHQSKNPELTPEQVTINSQKVVWWKCKMGHEWTAKIRNRTKAVNPVCPLCNSLAYRYPDIANDWHPEKNDLSPWDVTHCSKKAVWWKCPQNHEYQLPVGKRTSRGDGCQICSGKKVSDLNSVATCYPKLIEEWDPKKNKDLTPFNVSHGSEKGIWWVCKDCNNEWQASPTNRGRLNRGCPKCTGRILSPENSLQAKFPEIAKEWHPELNGKSTAADFAAKSGKKVWWKCQNPTHPAYEAVIGNRANGSECPYCKNMLVCEANSLETLYPEIASEWHPKKNHPRTASDVTPGYSKRVWWKCKTCNDDDQDQHEWPATVVQRVRLNSGCPFCSGHVSTISKSLAKLYPELAAEWDFGMNGNLKPENVSPGSGLKIWWRCKIDPEHFWDATVASRANGNGCPYCANKRAGKSNSLRSTHPELAAEWHYERNGQLTPDMITAGSAKKVWWKCPNGEDHIWETTVYRRMLGRGCHRCNRGWTIENIRHFVKSLLDQQLLIGLTPAELWVLFQQNGLAGGTSQRRDEFGKAFASGKLPIDELEKFANEKDSKLDLLFGEITAEEAFESDYEEDTVLRDTQGLTDYDEDVEAEEPKLPELSAGKVLDVLESNVWSIADEEAVEFLVASGVGKLWGLAYDPSRLPEVLLDTESPRQAEYAERVRVQFRSEYEAAQSLQMPEGYSFQIDNEPTLPNLMQRHVAALIKTRKRVGNWSGTGAGKTLSAVLASRVIESKLTVILCPNATVQGWKQTILNAFPNSQVATKTLSPHWNRKFPKYLILNYETLQQTRSEPHLSKFLSIECPDMVVIDEIHYTKQRSEEASKRRTLTEGLCSVSMETNPNLAVLGMSATPVINNLTEGVSMVNLVTGLAHKDLSTKATVSNCMKLHQRLITIGTRWRPPYPEFRAENPRIDISHSIADIRSISKGSAGQLQLEQILIQEKLGCILSETEDGTLVYTEYVAGIVPKLKKALSDAGWKVGVYTGQDKTGLKPFLERKLDVLIGSSAIGTGVDGLQHRASKLVVACAPWTSAAYEQLVGRLVRQGQKQDVTIIFPITFAEVNGDEWSWCQSRLNRIKYKKSIADAAVDGVVPIGQLRTPTQAFADTLGWLKRLDIGGLSEIRRSVITVPLSGEPIEVEARIARYGEFSTINQRWNATRSDNLHETLSTSPEEWEHYHTLYREARTKWTVIPFDKISNFITQYPKKRVIGDFGCGEDFLGRSLREKGYTVHSFDHVAISDQVTACDIGQEVPLGDAELDIAVFSLSLMGANTGNYLREAARTLVFDGRLIIAEATQRLPEEDRIRRNLEKLGFQVTDIFPEGQFTFIHSCRTDDEPDLKASLFDK